MGNKQSTTTTSDATTPQNHNRQGSTSQSHPEVLLWGCNTKEEHIFTKALLIQVLRPLTGEEGLIACGIEYRSVKLQEDGKLLLLSPPETTKEATATTTTHSTTNPRHIRNSSSTSTVEPFRDSCACRTRPESGVEEEKKEENPPTASTTSSSSIHPHYSQTTRTNGRHSPCCRTGTSTHHNSKTMTRLFHRESGTMITTENRSQFIADGAMYDIVSRLAMEYTQEVMMRDAQLEWVTIPQSRDADEQHEHEQHGTSNRKPKSPTTHSEPIPIPIRALVSTRLVHDESRIDTEPTLLITTGNGRVRAGVFSRQHLLTSGLECSTAVPFVREAHKRNINLVVLDPNAHGDKVGMVTFEKSMKHLFRRWEETDTHKHETPVVVPAALSSTSPSPPPPAMMEQQPGKNLYVLSHSQSGSQFVRYLLDKSHCYLPRICATAFTDSTHNIQWTTKRKHLEPLKKLLESDDCIYFKRSHEPIDRSILNPLSTVGQAVDTDQFWKHRFGEIKTLCAGTSEHSLTNWFVRYHIWEHFDRLTMAVKNNNRPD